MKLMNAEKTIQKVMDIVDEMKLRPEYKDAVDKDGNKIKFGFITSVQREKESDGNFHIIVELHREGIREKKVIVVYFVEHLHGITTIMVNGLLHNVIFENSTMSSPDIVLTYLPEAIMSDIKILSEKIGCDKRWKDRRIPRKPRNGNPCEKHHKTYHSNRKPNQKKPYKKTGVNNNRIKNKEDNKKYYHHCEGV